MGKMKSLSKVASAVQPSSTLAIDTLAKQMRADGIDVIGFGTAARCWPARNWCTPTPTAGAAKSPSSTAPPSSGLPLWTPSRTPPSPPARISSGNRGCLCLGFPAPLFQDTVYGRNILCKLLTAFTDGAQLVLKHVV